MRYDKEVEFIIETSSYYDPKEGKTISGTTQLVKRFCAVYDLSTERKLELYGNAMVRALTLHYRGGLINAKKVKVDGMLYHVLDSRQLRNKGSMTVGESKL